MNFRSGILAALLSIISVCSMSARPDSTATAFRHLDLGVNVGTTGLGLELATPISSVFKLRAGVDFFPRFAVPMSFDLVSYTEGDINNTDFSKLQDIMYQLSGFEVDRTVHMDGKATMTNFKMMLDVYPWKSNNWHLTLGFYLGGANVGKATNTIEEMSSMLAIGIYNNMYDRVMSPDFIDEPLYGDYYIDPDVADQMRARFEAYGRIGVHVGNYVADGRAYVLEPGADGMVRATMKVNRFKPYIGVGYNGPIKGHERWNVGFDAGVMMWGKPKIYTHEGVDIANQVDDIAGKVGSYINVAKALQVYPTLNFRISYRLF